MRQLTLPRPFRHISPQEIAEDEMKKIYPSAGAALEGLVLHLPDTQE